MPDGFSEAEVSYSDLHHAKIEDHDQAGAQPRRIERQSKRQRHDAGQRVPQCYGGDRGRSFAGAREPPQLASAKQARR